MAFVQLFWRLWDGKHQQLKISNESSLNSLTDSGTWEFPLIHRKNMASSSKRVKRKCQHQEESRKIGREHDVLIVPSDVESVSESDSDDLDWSIGWLEPHGPEFQRNGDSEDSFAVLVPCYGHRSEALKENLNVKTLETFGNIPDIYHAESKKYMEQWILSLQNC